MRIYTLQRATFVRRPRDEVFEFFSRPENLARITPSWLGFRILTPLPILMEEGALIDYTVKVLGVRVRWQTVISEYRPPQMFVDEQRRGPYASWRHMHSFTEVEGGTRILDDVQFGMPFGVAGRIFRTILVRRQLDAIFAYRARVIEEYFTGEQS